jgi:hypothetical protein
MVHDAPFMLLAHALMRRRHLRHLGQCRRAAATLAPHGTDAGIGSRGGHGTAPSAQLLPFPLRTGPAPPREDATGTSGRESRGSAGSSRRRQAARRARDARAAARRGRRLAGRRVGGRAGGRRARAARVEPSSILGGLTARRGTPAHLRQSLHLPSLQLGWKAAPRRLV